MISEVIVLKVVMTIISYWIIIKQIWTLQSFYLQCFNIKINRKLFKPHT